MTGPLVGAVAGPVGPVAVAEEAVAAAGAGPAAAAEEAVAAAGAVVEALASPPPAPTPPVPIEARSDPPAPLPVGLMAPDEITPAHTAGRHRGEAAAPMPAAHPTYAGTHSAKSSAVAYSRLTNPRRGPTGSAEETDACFIVCDHNRQALAYLYLQIAGIVGGALDRRRPRASLRVSPLL